MSKEEAEKWSKLFSAYAQGKKILVHKYEYDEDWNKLYEEPDSEDEWIARAFEQIGDPDDFKVEKKMKAKLILERATSEMRIKGEAYRKVVEVEIPDTDNSEAEEKGVWTIRGYAEIKD